MKGFIKPQEKLVYLFFLGQENMNKLCTAFTVLMEAVDDITQLLPTFKARDTRCLLLTGRKAISC